MDKILIRHSKNQYIAFSNLLINSFGFVDFPLTKRGEKIKSKFKYLLDLFEDSFRLFCNHRRIKKYDEFFCISWAAIPILWMILLKIIKPKKFFWFGFFIHSSRYLLFFKYIFLIINRIDFQLVVFTEYEIELYQRSLNIDSKKILYLPYGDWDCNYHLIKTELEGDYYFAGGYSNRDYKTIIDVFNKNGKKLIIACSRLNKEVFKVIVNNNIDVFIDISSSEFEGLVKGAKTCILFLKQETGASGQSVLLRYMRNGKAIIANNSKLILEYVDNNCAFILNKSHVQLYNLVDEIDEKPDLLNIIGNRAYEKYQNKFSYEACKKRLIEVLNDD
jgi:glycosyltransferase involved in cell wall biosynthesis